MGTWIFDAIGTLLFIDALGEITIDVYSGSLVKTEIRSFLNESVQGLREAS